MKIQIVLSLLALALVTVPGASSARAWAQVPVTEPAGGPGAWSTARLVQARSGMSVARLGSQVFFAGGKRAYTGSGPTSDLVSDAVDVYDDATGSWASGTLSEPRSRISWAQLSSRIFFLGGLNSATWSAAVDVYDTATGEWTVEALPRVRSVNIVRSIGNQVVLVGTKTPYEGVPPAGQVVADSYDDTTGAWSTSDLELGNSELRSMRAGGKLLVRGVAQICSPRPRDGCTSQPTTDVAIYDGGQQRWTMAQLSRPRLREDILAAGSTVLFSGGAESDVADGYDAETDRWATTLLPRAVRKGRPVTGRDNAFYRDDGSAYPSQVTLDMYNAAAGTWTSTTVPHPHAFATKVLATGPLVLVVPGEPLEESNGKSVFDVYIDIYDTETGTWRSTTMPHPHSLPEVEFNGTRVLLLPGRPFDNPMHDVWVDVYDTATDEWVSNAFAAPRWGFGTSTVGSRTLIAGGWMQTDLDEDIAHAPTTDLVDIYDSSASS